MTRRFVWPTLNKSILKGVNQLKAGAWESEMSAELLIITMQLPLIIKKTGEKTFLKYNSYKKIRIDYQNSFISVDFGSFIKKRTKGN